MPATFSIITVTRNHAAGLCRTLESIAAQSCRDFEVLVVDGRSTDETPSVLNRFEDLPIVFLKDSGEGVYAAMNQGVQAAKGEWVIFMNAGDCFYDSSVLARFNAPEGVDLLYGNAWKEDRSRAFSYRPFEEIWKGNVFCHQSLFARSEILRRFPFREKMQIVADYAFYIDCLRDGCRFSWIDLDVAIIEPGGISAKGMLRRTRERYPIARKAFSEQPVRRYYFGLFVRQLTGLLIPGAKRRPLRGWRRLFRRRGRANRKTNFEV